MTELFRASGRILYGRACVPFVAAASAIRGGDAPGDGHRLRAKRYEPVGERIVSLRSGTFTLMEGGGPTG